MVDIPLAKQRLPLPDLMEKCGDGEHAKMSAKCPFHEDVKNSFSIFDDGDGWRFKCHAGCGQGDEIHYLMLRSNVSKGEAIRIFGEMAGGSETGIPLSPAPRAKRPTKAPESIEPGPSLPGDATEGTIDDWKALADLRGIHWHAVGTAAKNLGTLYFGTMFKFKSWILTDERKLCMEARRMDGLPYPAIPEAGLGERKAHTLRRSNKSWPVGLAIRGLTVDDFRAVLIVEGGPDYLAALAFTLNDQQDCLPIAMLGASVGGNIHPDAIGLLRGRRVRFYPHVDEERQGQDAVVKWGKQLSASEDSDEFDFTGLRMANGKPLKDLNDCVFIHEECRAELENLLP